MTIKIINLALVLGLVALPSIALGQTGLASPVATSTVVTPTCATTFSGYVYNQTTNSCQLETVTACDNPFTFSTKLACETENVLEPKDTTTSDSPIKTIQDRARATRESFLRRGQSAEPAPTTAEKASSLSQLEIIEEKVTTLRERAIVLSFTRIIVRVQNYQVHLSQIIDRLDQKVTLLTGEGKDTTAIEPKMAEVKSLSASTSLTLASALTATESAFSDPNNDPASILARVKAEVASTTIILEQEKTLIREVIEDIKNLL